MNNLNSRLSKLEQLLTHRATTAENVGERLFFEGFADFIGRVHANAEAILTGQKPPFALPHHSFDGDHYGLQRGARVLTILSGAAERHGDRSRADQLHGLITNLNQAITVGGAV